MKQRIFITMHYLEIGGAEISLIGLLQAIDYNKYDVDLFIHAHHGELMSYIPKEVNLLPEVKKYSVLEKPFKDCVRSGCFDVAFMRFIAKFKRKRYYKTHPEVKDDDDYFLSHYTTWLLPKINPSVEYDLAISFLTPHKIVLDKVKAKKKVAWIHTDYQAIKVARELALPAWEQYDKIASISKDITKTFTSVFPTLSDKIIDFENILSSVFVRKRAALLDVDKELDTDCVKLLSVGRFAPAKNYDNLPDICSRMIKKGAKIKWYIIGYGADEQLIRRRIAESGMEEHVIILGKRSNPYPYIKACDIYVQPSRYEGKSVTVREAQILCKPVAITAYSTARSQVKDGVDGVIVPMDNEGCAQGLVDFIGDTSLQEQVQAYLRCHDYGNEREVEKLELLMK